MKKKSKVLLTVLLVIFTPLALFYLFVFPALIASGKFEIDLANTLFGLFLYIQMWMLIAEYAYMSAARLYNFRRTYLFPFLQLSNIFIDFKQDERQFTRFGTVIACLLSYFLSIYGFAIAYLFVSTIDASAFSIGQLNWFTSVYFSLGTATTSAFGDIIPLSTLARSLTMIETIVGLVYALFFFSLLSDFIRSRDINR